ncbi:hypothetical protein Lal_00024905 [Lupinus albus]|uniref:Uncharacterized protein n=1 Tax=Lupinus albus TaxID=3870 RepID=A0A6A5NUG6_LUPAL|nr:hypothetical protein Lalb_Chr10g0100261 [Lupinus albus]KAF1889578.1 hypothetical protein Lal_00024905 [Lupinus albus]
MAETGKERDPEIDKVKENEEGEDTNGESSLSQVPNKSLAELNMLLVSLSLVSVDDDCMEHEESEHNNNVKHKVSAAKTSISRLQTMNGDLHEPKLAKRASSTRLNTTIRDCRHGRKM